MIRKGMYDVCNSQRGTAHRTMSRLPIIVAGKTGTSQVVSIPQKERRRMKESEMEYIAVLTLGLQHMLHIIILSM